jgi:hypothetical protein
MLKSWVKISLDSAYFVAGEKVSGEIFACIYEKETKILIKVRGEEKVNVHKTTGQSYRQTSCILNLQKEIQDPDRQVKSIFPFAFSLPLYCPASFHLSDHDNAQNDLNLQIHYSLEAELLNTSSVLSSDLQEFTVFSKHFRSPCLKEWDFSRSLLKSCCCISRGSSFLRIDFLEDPSIHKFRIQVQSRLNHKLTSLVTQVVFKAFVDLQTSTSLIQRVLARDVKTDSVFFKSPDFSFEFLHDSQFCIIGPNVASVQGKIFKASFEVQVVALYDVGFRTKEITCMIPFLVNPAPTSVEKFVVPNDWMAAERVSDTLVFSSGSSYNTISED